MRGLSEQLRNRRVTGSAGGGMVEIELNGLVEAVRCHVDPALLAQQDAELLEDLVISAVNQAVVKAKQLHSEAMKSLTGGLAIPGLEEAIAAFLKTDPEEADPNTPPQP